ncbi:3-oxoacyl-[acyl-carrier protein] reductase [Sphingobium fuliginis]|uniref:3-oxoacyl-[acyl-carrier protein] reductase n=1 Tax=Sphingobium fuliginis (strain ATCC 27551) TaxID=336203 RepID=A0A292ZBW8_SPHSA|nr:3-oxoacyl-[acyl-carrier protein] reductase [Sphingobium fuliginis]
MLAANGASVLLADINIDGAKTAAANLREHGFVAEAVGVDMAREDQIAAMVASAIDKFGRLDALHNNVALLAREVVGRDLTITDLDADIFRQCLDVNMVGAAVAAKYAIPHIIAQGGGAVINTASIAGIRGEIVRPIYGSSKAGLIGLSRSIAAQYGKKGVRAVTISPGLIITPSVAKAVSQGQVDRLMRHALVTRAGKPEDVGNLAAFLIADEGSYLTGIDIVLDGGFLAHWPTYAEELEALHEVSQPLPAK